MKPRFRETLAGNESFRDRIRLALSGVIALLMAGGVALWIDTLEPAYLQPVIDETAILCQRAGFERPGQKARNNLRRLFDDKNMRRVLGVRKVGKGPLARQSTEDGLTIFQRGDRLFQGAVIVREDGAIEAGLGVHNPESMGHCE